MITFDPTKLTINIVRLKSITTALGGSLSYLDEDKSTEDKEVLIRVKCPLSVARAFIMANKKITKYLIPVYTAIVTYDDHIVCLERHPLGTFGTLEYTDMHGEDARWIPDCERNLKRLIYPMLYKNDRNWFFDGRYIYAFSSNEMSEVLATAPNMTDDNTFRKIIATAIDTQVLWDSTSLVPSERTCVAFVTSNGEYSISPPIWKNLNTIGRSRIDDELGVTSSEFFNFDTIDEKMLVNLNFALAAGGDMGSKFGYDKIEPLQLPRLMIELHTVNLPNMPKHIKATYDIGISFKHTMAWLLGLLHLANDLDSYIMMRLLMKYLSKTGIYRKDSFSTKVVLQENADVSSIKLVSVPVRGSTPTELAA